jgi:hypothetical protein
MATRAVAAASLVCALVVARASARAEPVNPASPGNEAVERPSQPAAAQPLALTPSSGGGATEAVRRPRAQPVALAPVPVGPINPFAIAPRAGRVAAGGGAAAAGEAVETAEATGPRHNLVFLELGGNGILYTLNYDRAIAGGFTIRVGVGQVLEGANPIASADDELASVDALGIPILANFVGGGDRHRLELGAGVTLLYASARSATRYRAATDAGVTTLATALIGYRYVPPGGGFTYRAGFTPLVSAAGVLPWAGLSFGYLF